MHSGTINKEHATITSPPMTLYDTDHCSITGTVDDVARWIPSASYGLIMVIKKFMWVLPHPQAP